MKPLVHVRVDGVRLGLDRPDAPHRGEGGRLWVDVQRGFRRREEILVTSPSVWLTSEERVEALKALEQRDIRLEAGVSGGWD